MKPSHLVFFFGGLALCAGLLLAGVLVSVESEEPEPEPELTQEFNAKLAARYVEAGCWRCHMVSTLDEEMTASFGKPASGARATGPDLAGVARRFHTEWHVLHFWRPEWAYAGSQMPAQRQLFEREYDEQGRPRLNELGKDVVAFMMTLDKPSGYNNPWPAGGHVAPAGYHVNGRKLYVRECASCHGDSGEGDGPAALFFHATRKPANLRGGEILRPYSLPRYRDMAFTGMTNGVPGTGMPAFHERLSDQQRADIAAYLARLAGKE